MSKVIMKKNIRIRLLDLIQVLQKNNIDTSVLDELFNNYLLVDKNRFKSALKWSAWTNIPKHPEIDILRSTLSYDHKITVNIPKSTVGEFGEVIKDRIREAGEEQFLVEMELSYEEAKEVQSKEKD